MDFTSAEQVMDVVSDALRSLGIDKPLGYKSCLSSFACGLVDHSLPFKMRLNSVFFRVGDFVSAVTLREFLLSERGMFHEGDLADVCQVLDLFRGSPVEQEVEGFIYVDEDTGLLRVSLYMVSVVVPDFSRSLASLAQLPGDELPIWRGDGLHDYVDSFKYVRDTSKILKMAELIEEAMNDPEELDTEDDLLVDLWYTID